MRSIVAALLVVSVMMGGIVPVYAGDWDVFGKIMAGVEGLRVLSNGEVDIIGSVTGVKEDRHKEARHKKPHPIRIPEKPRIPEKKVWKRIYIPEHEEYSEKYGRIIVEGHYIRCKARQRGRKGKKCPKGQKEHRKRHSYKDSDFYYSLDDLEEFEKLCDKNIIDFVESNKMKKKVLSKEGQPRKSFGIDPSIFRRLRELKKAENENLIDFWDYSKKKNSLLAAFPEFGYCKPDRYSLFDALYELDSLENENIIDIFEFNKEKKHLLALY
jgi:hypothetical protein